MSWPGGSDTFWHLADSREHCDLEGKLNKVGNNCLKQMPALVTEQD